jgi:hypothetical protein
MNQDALAKLYPNLSPDELVEAKENLDRYLLLAWEIWETKLNAQAPTLTDLSAGSRIKAKVDSPN